MNRYLLGFTFSHVVFAASVANGFSLSSFFRALSPPLPISSSNTAQPFDGWGTSLAWFGEYVGSLEGRQSSVYTCADELSGWYVLCIHLTTTPMSFVADSQVNIVADMLFDPDVGLGLEIVRYNIGGSNTTLTAVNSMRPFAAIPSTILANGSYNWTLVSSRSL